MFSSQEGIARIGQVLDVSEVGPIIMKLIDVGEIITAPKLTVDEIDNIMHFTIIEYLDMRVEAIDKFGMDRLKPKHHFMSHYSQLYKQLIVSMGIMW